MNKEHKAFQPLELTLPVNKIKANLPISVIQGALHTYNIIFNEAIILKTISLYFTING